MRERRDDRVQERTDKDRKGTREDRAATGEEAGAKGREPDIEERERGPGADPQVEALVRHDLNDPGAEHGDGEAHALGHGRERVARPVQRTGRAVSVDDRNVLDADAEPAREIDPGLDREGHPRLEALTIAAHEVGMLVAVETDAVAGAMDEELAVPGLVDHAPGRSCPRRGPSA